MSLEKLDTNTFEQLIYDEGRACLVMFSRKSCHVCQKVIPVLEELRPNYEENFGFYYVDVEDDKALFQRFSLKGVPQILYFKDGEYQGKMAGAVEDDKVEQMIIDILEA
ncbi:MAG TPA: thioredoxin family protein [Desulfitobacterium dehalogenans]|uniref:Thioredoxin family protein n=1 Tax=Desulfitobacterium dehalogenans TaxID=36854 RepID=A0A7C6Z6N4_9FIRM|nr:thioredoxin family protein [Desulfitobacterium dehalogenans]